MENFRNNIKEIQEEKLDISEDEAETTEIIQFRNVSIVRVIIYILRLKKVYKIKIS